MYLSGVISYRYLSYIRRRAVHCACDVGWPKKKIWHIKRESGWIAGDALNRCLYRGAHASGCFYDDCFPFYLHKSRDEIFREHNVIYSYTPAVSSVRRSAGSTCRGISPGHRRRHAREQIEVLMCYIIIILIFMRSAGLGSPWTLVSSPHVHNSRTRTTRSIARVPYTNNCAIGRTRIRWCTVALDR